MASLCFHCQSRYAVSCVVCSMSQHAIWQISSLCGKDALPLLSVHSCAPLQTRQKQVPIQPKILRISQELSSHSKLLRSSTGFLTFTTFLFALVCIHRDVSYLVGFAVKRPQVAMSLLVFFNTSARQSGKGLLCGRMV